MPSSPKRGARTGYDGHTRRTGGKVHSAVDTLGHLLALVVIGRRDHERAQVAVLAAQVQEATSETVERSFVDQGYTGAQAAQDAAAHGIRRAVGKLPEPTRGFVLLPRSPRMRGWVGEHSFSWMARVRRVARDDEHVPDTLAGLHFLAFAMLMLKRFITFMVEST